MKRAILETLVEAKKAKRAAVETRVNQLEQQLDAVRGGQRHHWLGQRLFEAKESMAQNVEDSDRDCEAPQSSEAIGPVANFMRTH